MLALIMVLSGTFFIPENVSASTDGLTWVDGSTVETAEKGTAYYFDLASTQTYATAGTYGLMTVATGSKNALQYHSATYGLAAKEGNNFTVKVAGKPLSEIIGTAEFPVEEWKQMQQDVTKGGAKIIELRGRSSFQSPSYLSVEMIRSAMGGEAFRWPAGTFVNNEKYKCIMMAMKTTLDATGCHFEVPTGTADEVASLDASYEHLCKMRDELVTLNIVPPVSEWSKINPNL